MKNFFSLIAVIALMMPLLQCHSNPSYSFLKKDMPASFDDFYKFKLEQSKKKNVRPGNEEKLIRFADKTPVAILYIHGFNASKGEGEFVVDKLANELKYNTYYLRLPGHGTTKEDQASVSYKDMLDESVETLMMMQKLGDRVIVIGTSMGGLIATYLAAEYPEKVSGLVLASPFYNFTTTTGRLLFCYPTYKFFTWVAPLRVDTDPIPPEKDNWTLYWYQENYLSSTKLLVDLVNYVDKKENYSKISSPVLLLYYYKDEKNQDKSASVEDMLRVYDSIAAGKKSNALNKKVIISNGSHVLTSKYVTPSDPELVKKEIAEFARKIK